METQYLYEYYRFGYNYYVISSGLINATNSLLIRRIAEHLDFLKKYDLRVTLKVLEGDVGEGNIFTFFDSLNKLKPNDTVTAENKKILSDFLRQADSTLDAELALKQAYVLTEKRFSLEKLLYKTTELFGTGIFDKFSDIAKKDFMEASKCIAFERSTAAAFHLMRATEDTLRQYYVLKGGKEQDPHKQTWGFMINELRSVSGISKPLLDSLDNIKDNFRNPTQHPELHYSLDESQDLFLVCIDAVTRIVKAM